MYNILKESHNGIGMLLLLVLLVVIIFILIKFILKKPFDKSAKVAGLIGLITVHVQILVGFLLYFVSPQGVSNFSGEAMGDTMQRFFLVEHPLGMIIAAVSVTIGYRLSKNTTKTDKARYGKLLVYYILGFAIISYLIPWFVWA